MGVLNHAGKPIEQAEGSQSTMTSIPELRRKPDFGERNADGKAFEWIMAIQKQQQAEIEEN